VLGVEVEGVGDVQKGAEDRVDVDDVPAHVLGRGRPDARLAGGSLLTERVIGARRLAPAPPRLEGPLGQEDGSGDAPLGVGRLGGCDDVGRRLGS
jgi:hypothetical protein